MAPNLEADTLTGTFPGTASDNKQKDPTSSPVDLIESAARPPSILSATSARIHGLKPQDFELNIEIGDFNESGDNSLEPRLPDTDTENEIKERQYKRLIFALQAVVSFVTTYVLAPRFSRGDIKTLLTASSSNMTTNLSLFNHVFAKNKVNSIKFFELCCSMRLLSLISYTLLPTIINTLEKKNIASPMIALPIGTVAALVNYLLPKLVTAIDQGVKKSCAQHQAQADMRHPPLDENEGIPDLDIENPPPYLEGMTETVSPSRCRINKTVRACLIGGMLITARAFITTERITAKDPNMAVAVIHMGSVYILFETLESAFAERGLSLSALWATAAEGTINAAIIDGFLNFLVKNHELNSVEETFTGIGIGVSTYILLKSIAGCFQRIEKALQDNCLSDNNSINSLAEHPDTSSPTHGLQPPPPASRGVEKNQSYFLRERAEL